MSLRFAAARMTAGRRGVRFAAALWPARIPGRAAGVSLRSAAARITAGRRGVRFAAALWPAWISLVSFCHPGGGRVCEEIPVAGAAPYVARVRWLGCAGVGRLVRAARDAVLSWG